jgi:hypothetical protein
LGEGGLADAGHVLDEEMAAGEEANERKAHHFGLAVNRRADGRLQFQELTEDIGREPNRRGHFCFPLGHYMFMILELPEGMAVLLHAAQRLGYVLDSPRDPAKRGKHPPHDQSDRDD